MALRLGHLVQSVQKLTSVPSSSLLSSSIKQACMASIITPSHSRQLHQTRHLDHDYKIIITTGDKLGAGTDAEVFINLIGHNGTSSYIELDARPEHFERSSVDEFTIDAPYLGRLHKLLVKHTSTGLSPAWLLKSIKVEDGTDVYNFSCNKWLEKDEGDDPITLLKEDSITDEQLKELSRKGGRSGDVNQLEAIGDVMDAFEERHTKKEGDK